MKNTYMQVENIVTETKKSNKEVKKNEIQSKTFQTRICNSLYV